MDTNLNGHIEVINTLYDDDEKAQNVSNIDSVKESLKYELNIVWRNVLLQILLHSFLFWEIYYLYQYPDQLSSAWTLLKFELFYANISGIGVTAGAHRLWSHRSYKAKLPLRVFLACCFAGAGQNDLYEWCRDHRVHHRFSETDADPHNANRGFFFSHMGWLMCKKHPQVLTKGKTVDVSDLLKDPVVVWQKKYYLHLFLVFNIIVPVFIPWYFWQTSLTHSLIMSLNRYALVLHLTWLVNSAAHLWGTRPYDTRIGPREQNFWKIFNSLGEMYHNYHHVFPFDYKASEYGWFGQWNFTALFIDLMAFFGLAYDLKSAPKTVVQLRKERTGEQVKIN